MENKRAIPTCIWRRKGMPSGVDEKCLIDDAGNYVGVKTGKTYPKTEYYHSGIVLAKVVKIDLEQQNGMIHLGPDDKHGKDCILKKMSFVGCIMPFRNAHLYGDRKVYQSLVTGEYYNDLEIELI